MLGLVEAGEEQVLWRHDFAGLSEIERMSELLARDDDRFFKGWRRLDRNGLGRQCPD